MKRHESPLWLTVLTLGWLLDVLFWKQALGVNFAIYAGLCLAGGMLWMHRIGVRMRARSGWLLALIALFAITPFLRAEPFTVSLAVLLTLLLMAVFAETYSGGRWLEYGFADYAVRSLQLLWSVISRPLALRGLPDPDDSSPLPARTIMWPLVRGLLLAVPVMLVFGLLLASADLVFRTRLEALFTLLNLERLPEYIFRLVCILAAAWALLGIILHAAVGGRDERLLAVSLPAGARILGVVESSMVLLGVVTLFAVFVAVQFRYLFGGEQNIGLQGYTFAEYARRGYGELMAVGVLSLILLLALGAFTRRTSVRQQHVFSGMSILVVLLVGIMLVSAGMRLGLYETAYGFTRLRTYAHVALFWLGLLLAGAVVLEVLRRERHLAAFGLMAAVGFALTLSLLDVDAFIVRQNVARAVRGQALDVPHLATLSTDSVPALAVLFEAASTPMEVKTDLGAALACRLGRPQYGSPPGWRSFAFSRWRSEQALSAVSDQLTGFRFLRTDGLGRVRSPDGQWYDCTPGQYH